MKLYQQGTQRIEVIVRKEGGGVNETGNREQSTDEVAGKTTTWRTKLFGSESPTRIKRVAVTNATHFLATAKQAGNLMLNYYISGLGDRNGDQALQEQVARNVEIVQDVTGVASSVAMGGIYGAWGGPIGVGMGMLMGAMSSGMSLLSKYGRRERDFSFKTFKENNAIEYQRARAGINLTTGRLR